VKCKKKLCAALFNASGREASFYHLSIVRVGGRWRVKFEGSARREEQQNAALLLLAFLFIFQRALGV